MLAMPVRFGRFVRPVALVLAVALAAGPVAGSAADPVTIPAILPLSGPGAFVGREEARVLQALEDYVNRAGGIRGRPIKFAVSDDQGSPQIAVQMVNDLIAKNVPAFLGPGSAGECGAVTALLKAGPVSYCLSPGIHPEAGSYMLSIGASTVDLIAVMVRYMRDRGIKRVAVITSTNASGQDGERSIDAALADASNKGMSIVAREHFADADLSVAAQITRIGAVAPQAVIAWASGTPFGTVLRNAHEAGLDVPIFTTPANQNFDQLTAYADFVPRELLFPTGPFAAPDQITDRTMRASVRALNEGVARLKGHPSYPGQGVWDPGQILVAAFRTLGTNATAAQVREYIANLKGWIGENGRYDFAAVPQRGLDGSSSVIVRWDAAHGTWNAASKLGGAPLR
jgi:branched-chain amino acid transport system substrate-binding protein